MRHSYYEMYAAVKQNAINSKDGHKWSPTHVKWEEKEQENYNKNKIPFMFYKAMRVCA